MMTRTALETDIMLCESKEVFEAAGQLFGKFENILSDMEIEV